MADKIEALLKTIYRRWKKRSKAGGIHPDEEDLAGFLDGCLAPEENERVKAHLIACDDCAEILALSLNSELEELKEVPGELLDQARDILSLKNKPAVLEIFLRLKQNALEIINATGDILLGQELVPAPVLRSRKIKDFKDEVTILKDFKDIRLEVRVENKGEKYFNLMIKVKQKESSRTLKDLRITLIKEGVELESYLSDWGAASFEHVLLGKYNLEVASLEAKLATVALEIKA